MISFEYHLYRGLLIYSVLVILMVISCCINSSINIK